MTARRLASVALARAASLVPQRQRFAVMRALAGLAPRRATFGMEFNAVLDNGPSIALFGMSWAMTRAGVEFDPELEVAGVSELDALRAAGNGMLVVSGHFGLNHLAIRWLHDRGWPVLLVRGALDHELHVAGTRTPQPYVTQTQHVLVAVRSALRRGAAVLIDIDSHRPVPHAVRVGPFHLSTPALHVAERCGAPIVYLATRLERGRVRADFTPGTRADLATVFAKWLAANASA